MSVKAFRVDFKFTISDQASMYVIAEDEAAAKAGCMYMLSQTPDQYLEPEVIGVEEYKKPETETAPRLN